MRPIKFRGLSTEPLIKEDDWLYGSIIHMNYDDKVAYIQNQEVKFETVGQYTGIKDIGNKEIYHGDIVTLDGEEPYSNNNFTTEYDWELTGEVVYLYGAFWVNDSGMMISLTDYFNSDDMRATVIGNIYEDEKLLENNS